MEESVNIRDRIQGLAKWMVRLMYLLGLLLPLLIIVYLSFLSMPLGRLVLVDDGGGQYKHCTVTSESASSNTQLCSNFDSISGELIRDYYLVSIISLFNLTCGLVAYFSLLSLFKQFKQGLIFVEQNIKSANLILYAAAAYFLGGGLLNGLITMLYKSIDKINFNFDGYTLTVLISLLALSLFNALLRYGTALRSENELTI